MGKTILRFSMPLLALALAVPAMRAFAASVDDASVPGAGAHLVGVPDLKTGERTTLTVQGGIFKIAGKTASANISVSSIEDVLTSSESTQAGGKMGTAAKVGAMAAPYETGKVLTLILRTKVDLITVLYRGEHGGLHSVLLTVPKGQAEPLRSQLLAAGAHATERKP